MKDLLKVGVGAWVVSKLLEKNKTARYGNPASCPRATKDLMLNTENRNDAIHNEKIQYGPLNLSDNKYWQRLAKHWRTTPNVARNSNCGNCVAFDISPRMLNCIAAGPVSAEDGETGAGILGYCWMHHFKCHSARTCYTWAAGGPITDDKVSLKWQDKASKV